MSNTQLTAVVASFGHRLPWDGGKCALEESVIDDIALVIFTFDDPVTGKDLAFADIGEDDGWLAALCCSNEKGPAGPIGSQVRFLLTALLSRRDVSDS